MIAVKSRFNRFYEYAIQLAAGRGFRKLRFEIVMVMSYKKCRMHWIPTEIVMIMIYNY